VDTDRSTAVRTGIFTIGVLLALALIVASLNRDSGLFVSRYRLFANFDNIEGLFANSPVRLAGTHIGRVTDVRFLPAGSEQAVRVELDLEASVRERIRSDSVASIHQSGVLGDMYIEITLGSEAGEVLEDGTTLASREPLSFRALADAGGELLENLVSVSASADRIVGEFDEAMGTESISSTLGSLKNIVTEIEKGDGFLHGMIYDDAGPAAQDLAQAVAELRGGLGEFRGSFRRVNKLLAEVESGEGLMHDLFYGADEEGMTTFASLQSSAVRLESVLRKIDEGEGSLGALLNDPTVYEDLKLLVGGARESALLRGLIDFVRREENQGE
jgi:phospholipid/cholesterol/gamma-HCH transport system substrate-binding protein